jgi:thiol-disulfide isomerase/thioredoxin
MTALPLLLLGLAATPGPRFIEDDFQRALDTARRERKVLFVDAWAPWCHTCVSMREHVLTRPAFAALEKDVVFAAIDTEKAGSAAFLERYPVSVWPTLFFIDAQTGAVRFTWVGSADEVQMLALLEAARGAGGALGEADELLARGQSSAAAGRYLQALGADAGTPTARAVLSTLSALTLARQHEVCARTALKELKALATPQEQAQGLGWGLACALELPPCEARRLVLQALLEPTRALLASGPRLEQVLADDVSGLYDALVQERDEAKDASGARRQALAWLGYLEGQAARARTPAERAVFDAHRVGAALAAGVPDRVVAPLRQSEQDFPKDYNPPARLAVAYRELGRLDEGLAAVERALGRCDAGPRKLRLYETKASLLEKKGDAAGRRQVLAEELAWARSLPRAQYGADRLAALEKRLAPHP